MPKVVSGMAENVDNCVVTVGVAPSAWKDDDAETHSPLGEPPPL